jgi:hypothetical protein
MALAPGVRAEAGPCENVGAAAKQQIIAAIPNVIRRGTRGRHECMFVLVGKEPLRKIPLLSELRLSEVYARH